VTDLTAFAVARFYFFAFLAKKSHVKPQNDLTHSPTSTYIWHFSSTQPAILDIEIKKEQSPDNSVGALPFRINILPITHMVAIF
jgi:hypothetical protein